MLIRLRKAGGRRRRSAPDHHPPDHNATTMMIVHMVAIVSIGLASWLTPTENYGAGDGSLARHGSARRLVLASARMADLVSPSANGATPVELWTRDRDLGFWRFEAGLLDDLDGVGAACDPELAVDRRDLAANRRDVCLDGTAREVKTIGDLLEREMRPQEPTERSQADVRPSIYGAIAYTAVALRAQPTRHPETNAASRNQRGIPKPRCGPRSCRQRPGVFAREVAAHGIDSSEGASQRDISHLGR